MKQTVGFNEVVFAAMEVDGFYTSTTGTIPRSVYTVRNEPIWVREEDIGSGELREPSLEDWHVEFSPGEIQLVERREL